jgi:hypothetical protein
MRTFATSPSEVTDEWLTDVLRQSGAVKNARIASHAVKIIGEGSGFMGELARVSLRYDTPEEGAPAAVIAKFPAAAPENRGVATYFHFYEREVGFYQHIAEQVQLRTPRCYFSAFEPSNGDYVLLLEDLSPAVVGDQVAGCSVDHVRLAVQELARFQATWWQSPELEALDWMPKTNVDWQVAAVEQGYAEGLEPFFEFAAAYLTPEVRDVANRFGKSVRGFMNDMTDDIPPTLVHGDYRLDNMFFASPQGGPDFAVIDWQIANRGAGVFDVAYFVTGTLPPEARKAREHEIVKVYHDTLVQHGVPGYSFDQCWQDYRASTLFLLPYSVIGAGSLDLSNERGVDLFTKIASRTLAAISDLKSYVLLD